MTRQERTNFSPAMAVSALLHLGVFALALIAWPRDDAPAMMGGVAEVTLVDPSSMDVNTAVEGLEELEAQSEAPVAEAPPAPTADPAPPTPAPPAKPTPAPAAPTKAAPAPTPAPSKQARPQTKAAPAKKFSLDDIAKEAAPATAGGGRQGGRQGPARAATSPTAREGAGRSGAAALADARGIVGRRLADNWTIDCSLQGMFSITVVVRFDLSPTGALVGTPTVLDAGSTPTAQAAEDRARAAVARAAPFPELPKESYKEWRHFEAKFRGRDACQ